MRILLIVVLLVAVFCATSAYAGETRRVTLTGNLDERLPIATALPDDNASFQEIESLAQAYTRLTLLDAVGQGHYMHFYFFHESRAGGLRSEWWGRAYLEGSDILGGTPGEPYAYGTFLLDFDANRKQYYNVALEAKFFPTWENGAPQTGITMVLDGFTNEDADTSLVNSWADGCREKCPNHGALDFDGDTKDDVAIFRPEQGLWAIRRSSDSQVMYYQWGLPGDYPMPGDYTGDGLADLVVWRPTDGIWYVCTSEVQYDCHVPNYRSYQFGLVGDRPLKGDYDGDGVLDLAVWRENGGLFIYQSSRTGEVVVQQWGLGGDIPLGSSVKD